MKCRSTPMRRVIIQSLLASAALLGAPASWANASPCEQLKTLELADTRIDHVRTMTATDTVALAGPFPAMTLGASLCRVQLTLTPTPRSSIKVEVWLPPKGEWNGKLLAVGNGGFGGTIALPDMRQALLRGYVTAATDTGHQLADPSQAFSASGIDAGWARGQPEKIIDYGYRANHLTAQAAKRLIAAYYGRKPSRAYFKGCSNGGREALMEAQRFPEDYDGIIAGAPANAFTRLMSAFAWTAQALTAEEGGAIPREKLPLIQKAVFAQCQAHDPLHDGYFRNPADCRFDPAALSCKGGADEQCLTAPQIASLRKIYAGPREPRSSVAFFPGLPSGGEAVANNWDLWVTEADAWRQVFAEQFFRNMVYGNPSWSIADFDNKRSPRDARRALGSILDSDDPDLASFKRRGGKLILYHGWLDAAIPPQATIDYYTRVQKEMGAESTHEFARLFMAPGVNHCGMGPGPDSFDVVSALEQWHEQGTAPERVIATKYENELAALMGTDPGKVLRTRPLCAYPQVARWNGAGSNDDAASFTCEAPRGINHLVSGRD